MGRRRRQSNDDLLFEVILRLVGIVVVCVLVIGGAGALRQLAGAVVAILAILAGIVLMGWAGRSWWRMHPEARDAVARFFSPSRSRFGGAPPGRILDPGSRPLPGEPVPTKATAGLSSLTALRQHLATAPEPFAPAPPVHPIPVTPTPPTPPSAVLATRDLTEELRRLDWYQFEKIVALIYRKLGHQVERRGGAHADGGIDLVLDPATKPVAVQCKHWKTWQVGVKPVREFLGALTAAGLKDGIFVALGNFTPDAATLASRQGIRLVDAADLADLVRHAGIASDPDFTHSLADPRKYCPKCERELVLRTASKGSNTGGQFWGCSGYPRCKFILRT